MMKIMFALVLLLVAALVQGGPNDNVVRHPQFPFEPIYLRKYMVTKEEAETLEICQTLTHDCGWAMIVVMRQESCIPPDFVLNERRDDPDDALDCPLLLQGYSVYDSQDSLPTIVPYKHHVTNLPGVDLPVFIFHRGDYTWWEIENGPFTYADLVAWANEQENVYRGHAKEFFESVSVGTNATKHDEGDLSVMVKGVLEDNHEFTFMIDEVGDVFEPIYWELSLTGDNVYDSDDDDDDDDDGLQEGELAGAIVGTGIFGILLGFVLAMFLRKLQATTQPTTTTTTTTTTTPHKENDPTESQTEAH